MERFYRLFSIGSVPVWTHWTLPLLLTLLLIFTVVQWFSPGEASLVVAILFGSLLLAELVQVGTTILLREKIRKIVLLPLGGQACTNDLSRKGAGKLMVHYLAGPVTNVGVSLLAFAHLPAAYRQEMLRLSFASLEPDLLMAACVINLGAGLLQLLPVLPMKGGRLLSDLLQPRIGRSLSYRILICFGLVTAVSLMVVGAFLSTFLLLVGILLLASNIVEAENEKQREFRKDFTVKHVMNTNIVLFNPDECVRDVLGRQRFWSKELVVVENRQAVGIISPATLNKLFREAAMDTRLGEVMNSRIKSISGKHRLEDLYQEANWEDSQVYAVTEHNRVIGVLRLPELHSMLSQVQREYQLNFPA
jgi:predicted transcriptional regulator/Zn-dependent protease